MKNGERLALLATGALAAVVLPAAWRAFKNVLCSRMAQPPKTHLVPASKLRAFVSDVLKTFGVPAADADTAADVLILADLRGIDSHGVARLNAYCHMFAKGTINPKPNVRVVRETPSTATVDGDGGLGLVVAPKANQIAMDKAAACGSGFVSVKNTYHYGIAGAYSLAALERDMIGLSMTNSSCVVAPLWGKERMLGTNPIAIAFPADRERPMVIDFATSVVPLGRIEECARKAQTLLPGWAIDRDGRQTLKPEDVMGGGALLNLGGTIEHGGQKGYCLSAMVDVLCAVLSGGNWGPLVDGLLVGKKGAPHGGRGQGKTTPSGAVAGAATTAAAAEARNGDEASEAAVGIGHFFGCLRIDGFRDVGAFKATMDAWISTFRDCAPIDPSRPVRVPGDPEWEQYDRRSREGVPVKYTVLADLLDISIRVGVPPPFDEAQVDLSSVKRVIVAHA